MKIALVHDYIKEYGGAERVLEALHEIWPDAPVFTSVYLPEFLGPHKERFRNWDIRTSFLQYFPFKEKLISPFRIVAPFMFKMFDFSKFDIVIVSATGAYIPNAIKIRNPKSEIRNKSQNTKYKIQKTVHICYCHTPPRYLYGYATAREWKKNLIFRVIGEIVNHFLRLIDFKSAQNVDYFIANSKNVAARIKKFYRKDSSVIYPPVEMSMPVIASGAKQSQYPKGIAASSLDKLGTPRNDNEIKGNQYFLAGGRLARPKHIDLIVRACQQLNISLRVFGRGFGGWEEDIGTENRHSGKRSASRISMVQRDSGQARMTNQNIEFVGEITDEEKFELMRNAKAYIFASEDEDFGITPVEAMSVGTPVIAYKSGGVVESVIDGKTGLFFDDLTIDSLRRAIEQFNNLSADRQDIAINPTDCIKQAQKFSKERFKREIKEFVESKL